MKLVVIALVGVGAIFGLLIAISFSPWISLSLLGLFWLWHVGKAVKGCARYISGSFLTLGILLAAAPLVLYWQGIGFRPGIFFVLACFCGGPLLNTVAERFARRTA